MDKTINIKGKLVSFSEPWVMGILNVTPDSFYAGSRKQTEKEIEERIRTILSEGGKIIDVGGYSSRPDATDIPEEEEMARLKVALEILRKHYAEVPVSVDTFRSGIARRCVEEYNVGIVNDISGGEMDSAMFETVASLHVPYILMHMKGTPQTMKQHTDYQDLMNDLMSYFSQKVNQLHYLGVCDVILDPGFGFSKTLEQNYILMNKLSEFAIFELPLLVGISRKRMIYQLLDSTAENSLNGTSVLNTVALLNGADILRVHDVKAAVEAVKIVTKLKNTL
ncbi:dihydropteroate synthase [Parabacteroides pacaensis]|uniref:dihydropteroate synthase n=1 Tax=Parabacteroides pacaensis TaxID=2086575 RepID=UPI000D0EA9F0|nr:dihydropteroate synthase [Parabacteroides pacaensis]